MPEVPGCGVAERLHVQAELETKASADPECTWPGLHLFQSATVSGVKPSMPGSDSRLGRDGYGQGFPQHAPGWAECSLRWELQSSPGLGGAATGHGGRRRA